MRAPASFAAAATVLAATVLAAGPALAHAGAGHGGGFATGFIHPIAGIDHLIAIVAVGLWGATLGGAAFWLLPVVFPLVMALGGLLAMSGVPLPAVETGIAVSALLLGLLIAFAVRLPLWVAGSLVGLFALVHGHAHGAELPATVDAAAYVAGFLTATVALHLAGLAFGLTRRGETGRIMVRAGGTAISLAGLAFLLGA